MKFISFVRRSAVFIIIVHLWSTNSPSDFDWLVSYKLYISLIFHFYKNAEEEAIKVKRTPVHPEFLNNIINFCNRNVSEEVNFKAWKNLILAHQFLWNDIFPCNSRKRATRFLVRLSIDMTSQILFEMFFTFLFIQLQSSVIIICTTSGVLNAFTKNLGVALGGAVDNNMVYTLSQFEIIGLKYCLFFDTFEAVPHQLPKTHLNHCVTITILSSVGCVIVTYILGGVHKSALPQYPQKPLWLTHSYFNPLLP